MLGVFRRRQKLFQQGDLGLFVEFIQSLIPVNGSKFNLSETFKRLAEVGIDGIILNKGILKEFIGYLPLNWKIIVQLSAASKHGLPYYNRTLICSVAEALRLGADAVSLQLMLGNDLEDKMLQDLSLVLDDAHQLGIPVLVDIRPQGGQIVNEFDHGLLDYCIGMGIEWGADMIMVSCRKSGLKSKLIFNCPVPLILKFTGKDLTFCFNLVKEYSTEQLAGICITDKFLKNNDYWSDVLVKLRNKLKKHNDHR